jgi:hypothetical protein
MIEEGMNHCEIVERSLKGERAVDEQTFASLAVLGERLERLKKLDEAFEDVAFSDDARKLIGRKNAVAVG